MKAAPMTRPAMGVSFSAELGAEVVAAGAVLPVLDGPAEVEDDPGALSMPANVDVFVQAGGVTDAVVRMTSAHCE